VPSRALPEKNRISHAIQYTILFKSNRVYFVLYALLFLAYLGGLFLDIMEVDAAQYAAMSMEMLKSKNFLQLYDGGVPYLDKPPLLFWLSSLSFYIFGISDFAYRLPSFLGSIIAVYCTYKLARQWYNNDIANWSALILASCQAFFLFNQDVKTDNLLTSMVIFAIWQLSSFINYRKIGNLLLGGVGVGLAMLAKGPIGLMLPAAAIGSHLLLTREWRKIFDPRWLICIPVILVVLSPFLVGLYEQWGWHGIKFFFWTQSFGRITGESEWKNDSTPFYFTHTFLWAFLPWTFFGIISLFMRIKHMIRSRFRFAGKQEGITIGGFVLIFIALSMSRYKLPHYIFVLFPLAAIFTADWINSAWSENKRIFKITGKIQLVLYILLVLIIEIILIFVFEHIPWFVICLTLLISIPALVIAFSGETATRRIIVSGALMMAAVNIGLNFGFYPMLMRYQASNHAGRFVDSHHIPADRFFPYATAGSHSLDYYSRRVNKGIYADSLKIQLKKHDIWLYVNQRDMNDVKGFKLDRKDRLCYLGMDQYPVQLLSLAFLNPVSRYTVLNRVYLLHLSKTE
jgi:4-amino-4-deoxy-L-arabinose transferase-like glycosyltransferase